MKELTFIRKKEKKSTRLEWHTLSDGTEIPLLKYPILEKTNMVKHCFTTRLGGVSTGVLSSLNLGFSRGDEKTNVERNYQHVAEAMDVSYENIVCSDQTHTTNVWVITQKDAGNGLVREKEFFDVDGMVTNIPGLTLATGYADCVPLYFVDPVHHAIGLSHSGWRGTVGRIGKVTLETMKREYGSDPAEVICAIGPSICQDCYEVSEDVAQRFAKEFKTQQDEILQAKGQGKYQLDLWKANEIVLREAGILPNHLATPDLCTCCNPMVFFSHRASHGKRGNLGAFLTLV